MKKINPLVIIGLAVLAISTVSAVGYYIYSNTVTINVGENHLVLTSDPPSGSTILNGSTVHLTATLTDINGSPIEGAAIEFLNNNASLGVPVFTGSDGKANFDYNVTQIIIYNFQARYLVEP